MFEFLPLLVLDASWRAIDAKSKQASPNLLMAAAGSKKKPKQNLVLFRMVKRALRMYKVYVQNTYK